MNFPEWVHQTKTENETLTDFIEKLTPYFTDTGFNAAEFEKKVGAGLKKIDMDIDKSLIPERDAENPENQN